MIECEKVGVALRVMPINIEHSIIWSLRKSPDYESLKDSLDEEIKFMCEHRRGPAAPNMAFVGDGCARPEGEEEYDDEGEYDE